MGGGGHLERLHRQCRVGLVPSDWSVYPAAKGGGTKKKVGGLTLPLNDCTEAGVQGLHT